MEVSTDRVDEQLGRETNDLELILRAELNF